MKITKLIIFLLLSIAVSCSFTNNKKTADEVESINDIKSIRFQLQKDSLYLGTWVTFSDKFDPVEIETFYIKDSTIRYIFYRVADHYKIFDTIALNNPHKKYYDVFEIGNNFCFGKNPNKFPGEFYYSISKNDSILYTFNADLTGSLYSISQKIAYPLQAMEIYKQYVTYCQKNDSNTIAVWQDVRHQLATRLRYHDGKYWMMYFSNLDKFDEEEVYLVTQENGTAICSKRNNKGVLGKINDKVDEKLDDYALPIDTMFSHGFKWKYYKQPKHEF